MLQTKIKDIEIVYDESKLSQIDYIKNVIENNYSLFLRILNENKMISLVPTDSEDIMYCSNFDKNFNNTY